MVIELKNVVGPQLNKSKHDFTGQAMLNNCKDKGENGGNIRPDSDIDLLIEFHPDHIPGLIRLDSMEIELTQFLGRKVYLRTSQDLSRYFREEVLNSAE